MSHYGVPWPLVRTTVRTIRRAFFSVDVPDQTHLVTTADVETLREALGTAHFVKGWALSYHYRGEDLNMRRPEYVADDRGRPWRQVHVRGFADGETVALYPHLEYEPTAYPKRHLHGEALTVGAAVARLEPILADAGIDYAIVTV